MSTHSSSSDTQPADNARSVRPDKRPDKQPDKREDKRPPHRIRLIVGLTLVLMIVVLLTALPSLSRQWIISTLEDLAQVDTHEGRTVTLDDVALGLAHISVHNLRIADPNQDLLHVQRLDLSPDWAALWAGHPALQTLSVLGAHIRIDTASSGTWSLPALPGLTEPDTGKQQGSAPGFGLGSLRVLESRLTLHYDNHGALRIIPIDLTDIHLGPVYSWQPEQDSHFLLQARVDKSQVKAQGLGHPLAPKADLTGSITWNDLSLPMIQSLLPDSALNLQQGLLQFSNDFQLQWQQGEGESPTWRMEGTHQMGLTRALIQLQDPTDETDALSIHIGQISSHTSYNTDAKERGLKGNLEGSDLQLKQGADIELKTGGLYWQGHLGSRFADDKSASARLNHQGQLTLKDLSVKANNQAAAVKQARVDGTVSIVQSSSQSGPGNLTVKGPVNLSLKQASFEDNSEPLNGSARSFKCQGLKWQGDIDLNQNIQNRALKLDGKLIGQHLSASLPLDGQQTMKSRHKSWTWTGLVELANEQLNVEGGLKGDHIQLELSGEPGQGKQELSIDTLEARALRLKQDLTIQQESTPPDLTLQSLEINNTRFKQPDQQIHLTRFQAGHAELSWSQAAHIDPINLSGLNVILTLPAPEPKKPDSTDKKASTPPSKDTEKTTKQTAEASLSSTPREDLPLSLQVKGLNLEQANIQLTMPGHAPLILEKGQLTLGAFSSDQPAQPTALKGNIEVGEFGHFQIDGDVFPMQPTLWAELKSQLAAFDLPLLNPYIQAELGDEIDSGTLHVDTDFSIKADQMDVKNHIAIDQMKLIPKAQDDEKEGGASLLNTAISLLEDNSGRLKIELPITGSIQDPQFNLSDVINQAMGKAIATGVLLYFQPLGAVLAIGKIAAGEFSTLQFNPVAFQDGQSQLDKTARSYLDDLGKRLQDRPGIRLKVCGVSAISDQTTLRARQAAKKPTAQDKAQANSGTQPKSTAKPVNLKPALLALAKARASTVRNHLISQAGLDRKRLVGCKARFDDRKGAKPQVRLGQ